MTYQDTMTPLERAEALKKGQPVDRLPIFLFHGTFGSRLLDMTYQESERTAENIARKEIAVYREYGCDNISVNFGLFGLGACLGSQFKYSENASPSISQYAIESLDELDQLDSSKARLEKSELLQKHLKAIQLIHDEISDEVEVVYEISGPMTAAASLIEPEQLLRATRKQPEKVHELLRIATDILLNIIDDFAQHDYIGFAISDPVASGALMSPKQYAEFSEPYTRELVEKMHEAGKQVVIHICGDTTKSLPSIARTGVDFISLDQKVDLVKAKEVAGEKLGLIGNVDPVKYFLQGSPADMDHAVKDCFDAAGDSSKGFYIAPGCSVPLDTPLENVTAYMEAARKYSRR